MLLRVPKSEEKRNWVTGCDVEDRANELARGRVTVTDFTDAQFSFTLRRFL